MYSTIATSPFGSGARIRGRLRIHGLCCGMIALGVLAAISVAHAQAVTPVGVLRAAAETPDTVTRTANTGQNRSSDEVLARVALGAMGTAAGIASGMVAGLGLASGCRKEDCTLAAAGLGALAGAVLGSAIVAGAPAMGSTCSALRRTGGGVFVAVAGGLLGGVAGASAGGAGVPVGFIAGTSIGGGLGASICR
jgi:hypothetical protein